MKHRVRPYASFLSSCFSTCFFLQFLGLKYFLIFPATSFPTIIAPIQKVTSASTRLLVILMTFILLDIGRKGMPSGVTHIMKDEIIRNIPILYRKGFLFVDSVCILYPRKEFILILTQWAWIHLGENERSIRPNPQTLTYLLTHCLYMNYIVLTLIE